MFKKLVMVIMLVLVVGIGSVYAGGYGNFGNCPNCINTPITNLCVGTAETITGTVKTVGVPGNGLVLNTANGDITVYGVGPYWYWDKQNVDLPDIGEVVTAVVSNISTTNYKILLSITVGSQTLQLRDPATCLPLWRVNNSRR